MDYATLVLNFGQSVADSWKHIPSNQRAAVTAFGALLSVYSAGKATSELAPTVLGLAGMAFVAWTLALVFGI